MFALRVSIKGDEAVSAAVNKLLALPRLAVSEIPDIKAAAWARVEKSKAWRRYGWCARIVWKRANKVVVISIFMEVGPLWLESVRDGERVGRSRKGKGWRLIESVFKALDQFSVTT